MTIFQSIIHKQKTALLVNIYYELHYFGIQDNYIPEAFSVKSLYPLDFHCSITIYEMQILHSYYSPCILMSVWTNSIL